MLNDSYSFISESTNYQIFGLEKNKAPVSFQTEFTKEISNISFNRFNNAKGKFFSCLEQFSCQYLKIVSVYLEVLAVLLNALYLIYRKNYFFC